MQKFIVLSIVTLLTGVSAVTANAQWGSSGVPASSSTKSSGPVNTPGNSTILPLDQFQDTINKGNAARSQDYNNQMQQLRQAGEQNTAPQTDNPSGNNGPPAPSSNMAPAPSKPVQSAPTNNPPPAPPSVPSAPATNSSSDTSSTTASPSSAPYTGYGNGQSPPPQGNSNGNAKSGGWNMGY